ncbi:MAG: HlyC/CorC family transporter, partial [Firmicutes bacterium]|nr:HlyC/CorC family transporter [Bacillota bacterium]
LIILGIVLCIGFSALFSASEMSLSSANKVRIENEAEEGIKKAAIAQKLIENFDDSLSAILIGNNLVNIAASSLSSVLVILLLGSDKYTWVATVIITLLVIIFGETIPKITAKQTSTVSALRVAPFVRFLTVIFKPIVIAVVFLVTVLTGRNREDEEEDDDDDDDESKEELATIIETAEGEGVLDEDQKSLLIAALDFNDISAFEVMTARVDIDAIDIDDDMDEIMELVQKTVYTRLPVYEESIDNIIGVLHLNEFLTTMATEGKADIRELMMEPVFVYRTTKLPGVLEALREKDQQMAIVTDEYSGIDGIITIEDVLEEVVGEIWDENDPVEEEIIERNEREYLLDGDLNIYDFLELVEMDEDDYESEYDSETVGGWVMEMLERFPVVGDELRYENFTLKVIEAEERRVDKVLLIIDEPEESDEDDE